MPRVAQQETIEPENGTLFMNTSHERLELLLAYPDGAPVLGDGLPEHTAALGTKPRKAIRGDDSPLKRRHDAHPNDLPLQRWGLVVPIGNEGDRMLEAVSPLIRLREEEQGAKACIYRVPPDMDAKATARWKDEVYWADNVPDAERPLYLLMLGDLHQTSIELQQSIANGCLVGRVHFANEAGDTNLDGYAAYAEKVVRFARNGTKESSPNLLYYVSRDGDRATQIGESKLVVPSFKVSENAKESGALRLADVRFTSAKTVDEFLAMGASTHPSVLFSVSHGIGAPPGGWKSKEEQWAQQGGLSIRRNETLTAERLRGQTFLPGGLWFCLACFGAGTPSSSVYRTWLEFLAKDGAYGGKPANVLQSLPSWGERPFVAALPQAALSNPAGPLAVIGHVDLAWSYGFSGSYKYSESRKLRFSSVLDVMVQGSRAGIALDALARFYRDTNDSLMAHFQLEADEEGVNPEIVADRVERGHLWMLRNDLRGYVLLGDPAVRLPLRQNVVAAQDGGSWRV